MFCGTPIVSRKFKDYQKINTQRREMTVYNLSRQKYLLTNQKEISTTSDL